MERPSTGANTVLQGPGMKIPNELVCSFATLLPLRMLFRLALVCTRWRAVLLSCPELWTRIHITFGQQNSRQDLWKPLMAACISRSQDLQLVVDLKVGNNFRLGDPNCVELVAVSDLLSDNMHRVKSLSVSFRFAARNPPAAPPTFLRARAPVLRALCLHVRSLGIGDALTIRELFSGHAPKLDRVELNGMIVILGQPFINLPSITQLCFKRHDWDRPPNEVLLDLLEQLPSLQRLTLDSQAFTLHPPCLKVLDIQIHVPLKWDAFIAFPNARSVCYALGGIRLRNNQWDGATANLEVVLQRYVQRPVRSLEMRLGPPIVLPPTGSDDNFGMTVKVDGVYIALDADWIRDSRLIASTLYLHDLERLVLHEGNWDDFVDLEMPRLRELTVYLRRAMERWPLKHPSSQRPPWALSLLRFALTLSLEKGAVAPLTLKVEDVATLVRGNIEPLALETLALRGCELSGPGIAELRALVPHAQIIFEETLEDDCLQPSGWPTSFVEPGGMVV